jgi:hypothetical protein
MPRVRARRRVARHTARREASLLALFEQVEALGSTWTVLDLGSLAGGLAPIGALRVVAQAGRIRHLSRAPRGHTKMLPTATRLTCQRRRRNDFKKL